MDMLTAAIVRRKGTGEESAISRRVEAAMVAYLSTLSPFPLFKVVILGCVNLSCDQAPTSYMRNRKEINDIYQKQN
jgi:hypothetical protein